MGITSNYELPSSPQLLLLAKATGGETVTLTSATSAMTVVQGLYLTVYGAVDEWATITVNETIAYQLTIATGDDVGKSVALNSPIVLPPENLLVLTSSAAATSYLVASGIIVNHNG
jgi:hypothetical protein